MAPLMRAHTGKSIVPTSATRSRVVGPAPEEAAALVTVAVRRACALLLLVGEEGGGGRAPGGAGSEQGEGQVRSVPTIRIPRPVVESVCVHMLRAKAVQTLLV